MITEILQHKIKWWLDESDIEHIERCIRNGFSSGELNHGEMEIRGGWEITKE